MAAKLLKNVTVGSLVKLTESGSPVEFYVAKHDYESGLNGAGRTLLVRKDCYDERVWDSGNDSEYSTSDIDTWLNDGYKAKLDANIQTLIGTTTFYYRKKKATTVVSQLTRSVFLLSSKELGVSPGSYGAEGSTLDVAELLRIAYLDGAVCVYFTRTPYYITEIPTTTSIVHTINTIGGNSTAPCNSTCGSRPCFTLPDTLYVLDDGTVVEDTPPKISGADGNLGTFSTSAPSVAYTVTDEDGDYVSVTIKLDGVTVKTHAVTLGESNTWQLTGVDWLKVLNGSHTITIIADDGYVQTERTYTFTKAVTSMSFTLAEPLPADDMITKAIESIIGVIPANATTKIEVCNNGYDASPTWEDVTQKVLAGEKFQLTNAVKTDGSWGYNVRVSVSRGSATGDIYISSMGGFFE